MFRVCIVVAVSTGPQARDDRYSIPSQLNDCREACVRREGWQVVREIVVPGHSRDYNWLHEIVRDCCEYAEMIDLVQSGAVNLLVSKFYDRLWRTHALQAQVSAICAEHGAQIYSVTQPLEPLPPDQLRRRRGMRGLFEAFSGLGSEEDQARRVESQRIGMEGRVLRRRLAGCNRPPYGYRRDRDGHLEPDPEERPVYDWIVARLLEGWKPWAIARRLNDMGVKPRQGRQWWDSAIHRIMENRHAMGESHWGRAVSHDVEYEVLKTPEVHERLMQMREVKARRDPCARRPLSGLCRCGYCGAGMSYTGTGSLKLQCNAYQNACNRRQGSVCRSNVNRVPEVEAFVLDAVTRALADPDAHIAARGSEQGERLRGELARLDGLLAARGAELARWMAAYGEGVISLVELAGHRSRLERAVSELREERLRAEAATRAEEAVRDRLADLVGAGVALRDLERHELHQVYLGLVRRVVVERGKVPRIEWW